jgi:hypothetical protein
VLIVGKSENAKKKIERTKYVFLIIPLLMAGKLYFSDFSPSGILYNYQF